LCERILEDWFQNSKKTPGHQSGFRAQFD